MVRSNSIGRSGIGGMSGIGESIIIPIDIPVTYDGSPIREAAKDVEVLGNAKEQEKQKFDANKQAVDDNTKSTEGFSHVARGVSWDLMLSARALSMVNTAFFGHNKLAQEAIGLVYGIAGGLRILTMVQRLYEWATKASTAASIAQSAANVTETGTTVSLAGARALLSGPVGWAAFAVGSAVVAGAAAYYMSQMPSRQQGGYIPETGPYMLHKGETVIPSGTNFSVININMSSGPISSGVDVDNMLNAMAKRMLIESRRRM